VVVEEDGGLGVCIPLDHFVDGHLHRGFGGAVAVETGDIRRRLVKHYARMRIACILLHLRRRPAHTTPQQDDQACHSHGHQKASPRQENEDCPPWWQASPGGLPIDSALWQQHDSE
jgi:hypothetical protein